MEESNKQVAQMRPDVLSTSTTQAEQGLKKDMKNSILLALAGIMLLTFVGGGAYYFKFQKGKSLAQNQNQTTQNNTNQYGVNSQNTDVTEYQNEKYGFKIEYPSELRVSAVDYDIQAAQREYLRKCYSGEIAGCGGSRWPDYQVRFQDGSGQTLFSVSIHVIPVAQNLGGKENNGFTYFVSGGRNNRGEFIQGVDESVVKSIQESLSFIPTKIPVQCLWTPEFIAVDVNEPGIEKNIYSQASGYYFDQETQSCKSIFLYHGNGPNIPFQDMRSCTSSCIQ